MKSYTKEIINFIDENMPREYRLKDWVCDNYTAGELMNFDGIRAEVERVLGDSFVSQTLLEYFDDPDAKFREEILAMVPKEDMVEIIEWSGNH
jgi:hypothetical protein